MQFLKLKNVKASLQLLSVNQQKVKAYLTQKGISRGKVDVFISLRSEGEEDVTVRVDATGTVAGCRHIIL